MNSKKESGSGLDSFFRLEFYKKKDSWNFKTQKESNRAPASGNNNGVHKENFAMKSDNLHGDVSKKFTQSRRHKHVYRSNRNISNNRSNSQSFTKNGYQISNPIPNIMTESFNQRSEVMKIERNESDNSSEGLCPDSTIETQIFDNKKYYESNNHTLTPHQLGQYNDGLLEPYRVDNFMNTQSPQVPLPIDESFKEYWWGIDEWNSNNNNNNWREGLHEDYVQNVADLLHVAEQRLQNSSPPEQVHSPDDSLEEFNRGAHVAPHSTEEDLFRRAPSEDEMDEQRMTSRGLEAAARRHVEGLRRTLRELLLRDEVARVSTMKRQCTAIDYPMQYGDCDLLPTRDVTQLTADSPTQLALDVFVAGSYNVGHVADVPLS